MRFLSSVETGPALYALYAGTGRGEYVAYVGLATKLRNRVRQHLVLRDSSVTTATGAVNLNPEYLTVLRWWTREDFADSAILEAAELVSFDLLTPALRSRGRPTKRALELYGDEEFRVQVEALVNAQPSGSVRLPSLEGAYARIEELEARIRQLEQRLEE